MKRIAVAAVGLVALASLVASYGGDDDGTKAAAASTAASTAAAKPAGTPSGNKFVDALAKVDYPVALQNGTTLGKPEAPVTIQMFEDFTCPHCLEFTATLEPGIVDELVKTGKARLEFHYFPLRQSSVVPMAAAQCAAEQNRFWDYQTRLFKEQAIADAFPGDKAGQALTVAFSEASLKGYATDLGLDGDKFAACYAGETAVQRIQDDLRQVDKLAMKGTPTFVVNGQPLLNGFPPTVAEWKKLVESTK